MRHSLYIAWRYLAYYKTRSLILVACISIIALLPLALEMLLAQSQRQLMSRARSTALILGAKGSSLDLVMNSLYFTDETPESVSLSASREVWDSGLALPIPLYVRFKARGHPIVGTNLDYFDYRGLSIEKGRNLVYLGECLLGSRAAVLLKMGPGDHLVSSPESMFDLAGVYPLRMKIAGVLAPSHSPDDLAVFVDLKTAWVIQGLGHGHQDVSRLDDPSLVLKREKGKVSASAKLTHYNEITDKNRDSFHFHGDLADYPVSAVLAVPQDPKSDAILRGRYLERGRSLMILRPAEVIEGLMQNIFRIKKVLSAATGLVGAATLLALILVFALSLKLRSREMQTIYRLGCRRLTMVWLVVAEIFILAACCALVCGAGLWLTQYYAPRLVRFLLMA